MNTSRTACWPALSPAEAAKPARHRAVAGMFVDDAYERGIFVCMRTTLNIDDALLQQAQEMTGETEKTKLVHLGLEALIQRAAALRLAALGGTDRIAAAGARRKSPKSAR